jgi:large subunit ribosomal protein L4
MKAKVLTLDSKDAGEILLNESIFGLDNSRKDILHRVVNWQLAKRQSGNHCAQIRSEVRGGKKKPHNQKGSGQARQGSKNAPHMIGGGVAMGPRTRSHAHDLPKKIRVLGLKTALSVKLAAGQLLIIKDAKLAESKTSSLVKHLKLMNVKSALIVDGEHLDVNFRNAASNIINVDVLPVIGANVYDILRRENLILTESAVKKLEERLA